jgi:hypothetical protein
MKNLGVTLGWCLGHNGPQDGLDHTHKPILGGASHLRSRDQQDHDGERHGEDEDWQSYP